MSAGNDCNSFESGLRDSDENENLELLIAAAVDQPQRQDPHADLCHAVMLGVRQQQPLKESDRDSWKLPALLGCLCLIALAVAAEFWALSFQDGTLEEFGVWDISVLEYAFALGVLPLAWLLLGPKQAEGEY